MPFKFVGKARLILENLVEDIALDPVTKLKHCKVRISAIQDMADLATNPWEVVVTQPI